MQQDSNVKWILFLSRNLSPVSHSTYSSSKENVILTDQDNSFAAHLRRQNKVPNDLTRKGRGGKSENKFLSNSICWRRRSANLPVRMIYSKKKNAFRNRLIAEQALRKILINQTERHLGQRIPLTAWLLHSWSKTARRTASNAQSIALSYRDNLCLIQELRNNAEKLNGSVLDSRLRVCGRDNYLFYPPDQSSEGPPATYLLSLFLCDFKWS